VTYENTEDGCDTIVIILFDIVICLLNCRDFAFSNLGSSITK